MKTLKLFAATGLVSASMLPFHSNAFAEDTADMTIDEIIEQAEAAEADLESFFKESVTTLTTGDDTSEIMVREWVRVTDDVTESRYEVHHADNDIDVIVGDDTYAISYNENEETAYEYYLPEDTDDDVDEDTEDVIESIEDLNAATMIETALEFYDVTINGTEELLDREAYHLTFVPNEEAESDIEFDMWVDTEFYVILKQHEIGEDYEFLLEVTEFEPNTDIEDDVFELEIPEGVEVISTGEGEGQDENESTDEEDEE